MFRKVSQRIAPLFNKNKKFFDLHEYQCKDIMRNFNIRVQKGDIALNSARAKEIAATLDPKGGLILKSQVHAGGRGKGMLSSGLKGGVKVCETPQQIKDFCDQMIGYTLVTHQTTKEGLKVNAVLVHEGVDIKREIYLAFILDRNSQKPCMIASLDGGMEIEDVDPSRILIEIIEPEIGLTREQAAKTAKALQVDETLEDAILQMQRLYEMFVKLDATQVEINPWAVDPEKKLFCIDAKVNIDDNSKFRQPNLVKMRKESVASEKVDPHEEKAVAAGLSYVALDGNIGCMVNGAGLAMATMDIIKLHGGEPANFLDVGGGANVNQIATAFEILSGCPTVKTILINIFGGILKCDLLADGIIQAAKIVNLKVPLVIRLNGTNAELGKEKLENFHKENKDIQIKVGIDLDDAAVKAVQTVKGN